MRLILTLILTTELLDVVFSECIQDGDFVCGNPEEVCVLRYTKSVEDPEKDEYKKQLETDQNL